MKTPKTADGHAPSACSPSSPLAVRHHRRERRGVGRAAPRAPRASADCAETPPDVDRPGHRHRRPRPRRRARPAGRAGGRAGVAADRGRAHPVRDPVGRRRPEGYTTWDTAEALPDGRRGRRQPRRAEPRRDRRARPRPGRHRGHDADDASSSSSGSTTSRCWPPRAPTPPTDPEHAGHFTLIAEATGRERAGARPSWPSSTRSSQTRREARRRGRATTTDFVYADGWMDGGNVSIRMFGQGSLVGELGEELGLTNAWTGEVDEITAWARPTSRA